MVDRRHLHRPRTDPFSHSAAATQSTTQTKGKAMTLTLAEFAGLLFAAVALACLSLIAIFTPPEL
jgi:hypothetical protein